MEGSKALQKRGRSAGTAEEGARKTSQALLVARMQPKKPDASGDAASGGRSGIAQTHGSKKQPEQYGHSCGRGHGR